jgi:hypothetical protein
MLTSRSYKTKTNLVRHNSPAMVFELKTPFRKSSACQLTLTSRGGSAVKLNGRDINQLKRVLKLGFSPKIKAKR